MERFEMKVEREFDLCISAAEICVLIFDLC